MKHWLLSYYILSVISTFAYAYHPDVSPRDRPSLKREWPLLLTLAPFIYPMYVFTSYLHSKGNIWVNPDFEKSIPR